MRYTSTEQTVAAAILSLFGNSAAERSLLEAEIASTARTAPAVAQRLRELVYERDQSPFRWN